ncbi:hypothetical protein IFM89_034599 [Coptis chinensis]|uniref:Uncharacterized protein n=1 Tax=Coptis chinensis TaxID=261450 RepID=A0A835LXP8_9MAGN|nr:hypothetical protein IFM89_034599 [Coptis chinensis]
MIIPFSSVAFSEDDKLVKQCVSSSLLSDGDSAMPLEYWSCQTSGENPGHKDKGRIRSQYVNSTLNPVHNFSQLMALKEYEHEVIDSQSESLE